MKGFLGGVLVFAGLLLMLTALTAFLNKEWDVFAFGGVLGGVTGLGGIVLVRASGSRRKRKRRKAPGSTRKGTARTELILVPSAGQTQKRTE